MLSLLSLKFTYKICHKSNFPSKSGKIRRKVCFLEKTASNIKRS